MVGKYEIQVKTNKVEFKLEVKRKYTILRGDSGTGKTRLSGLIQKSKFYNSGIKVICDLPIITVQDTDVFQLYLDRNDKAIYILDEAVCRELYYNYNIVDLTEKREGYFVLITRYKFGGIPYSCSDVYYMDYKNSIGSKTFYQARNCYEWEDDFSVNASYIITEDEKAGFKFYRDTCNGEVISAKGNSNLSKIALNLLSSGKNNIFIIADGSAFGSHIEKCIDLVKNQYEGRVVRLFIPESFEYLVLKSGIFKVPDKYLNETFNHADSVKFLSWERYYTWLLGKVAKKYKTEYHKECKELPKYLISDSSVSKMYSVIKEITNHK